MADKAAINSWRYQKQARDRFSAWMKKLRAKIIKSAKQRPSRLRAHVRSITIDDLPASAFPSKPDKNNLCLVCRIAKRQCHSWFCRAECEDVFIKKFEVENG